MPPRTRVGAGLGALSLLVVLSSCVGSDVVSPADGIDPSFAISDGTSGGSDDFYFLTPLADKNPNPQGEFNPYVRPEMRVCVIGGNELGLAPPTGKPSCDDTGRVLVVEPGSLPYTLDAINEQYAISWDTDGPETDLGAFTTSDFLLLEILVGGQVVGWIDLDPQDPNGPGQSDADAYAFRLGETIPTKFWIGSEVLCEPLAFVNECNTFVVDQNGANLSLEGEGDKLGVIFFENSLPLPEDGFITVTLERIPPADFFAATGEECIPGIDAIGSFDAPLFGDCLRVTTFPDLTDPLLTDALVSICIDPADFPGIDLTEEQERAVTMIRYDDNGTPDDPTDDTWEALADAIGDCPTQTASLLDVPESGLLRHAAVGINAIADFIGPEPVAAGDLRLGAFTSSFSTIAYTLPGQMVVTAGDQTTIHADATDTDVAVEIQVVDHNGHPVQDAVVHFETDDGTLSAAEGVSDANGNVTVTWTVDSAPGEKQLTATALGLLNGPVPDHVENYLFTAESVTVTALVCHDGWGTASVDGTFAAGEWECASTVPFSANISGGSAPASLHWMNDGANLYLAVRVQQPSLDKVNNLRFDFDNDADGVPEEFDDAIGYAAGGFFDQYLDARCLNRNQAGCGTADTPHGAGAVGNASGWTTFELSHPLTSQDGQLDLSVPAGARGDGLDDLGVFLSLQQGSGAQGNTQVPGFRSYLFFEIVAAPGF